MINDQLLQEMIDIVKNGKRLPDTTYFSNLELDELMLRKRSIPSLLTYLRLQTFPENAKITKRHNLSNKPVFQLIAQSPELQKYFQVADDSLKFADHLSREDVLDMIAYVRQNYKPTIIYDTL